MQRKPLPTQEQWDDINKNIGIHFSNIDNNPNLGPVEKKKMKKEILDQIQVVHKFFQLASDNEQEAIYEEQYGKKSEGFSYLILYDNAVTNLMAECKTL